MHKKSDPLKYGSDFKMKDIKFSFNIAKKILNNNIHPFIASLRNTDLMLVE